MAMENAKVAILRSGQIQTDLNSALEDVNNAYKNSEFNFPEVSEKGFTVSNIINDLTNDPKIAIKEESIFPNLGTVKGYETYEAIPFNSIIECEIIEDNSTIMKSGLNRAIVGAAIAGTTGAIIGVATRKTTDVVNNLSIRIITNEVLNPHHEIKFVTETMNRNSDEYKQIYNDVQEIYSSVIAIIDSNK